MEDTFKYADDLGPLKVVHVYEPTIGLKGVLVVDKVAAGERFRLARVDAYREEV